MSGARIVAGDLVRLSPRGPWWTVQGPGLRGRVLVTTPRHTKSVDPERVIAVRFGPRRDRACQGWEGDEAEAVD